MNISMETSRTPTSNMTNTQEVKLLPYDFALYTIQLTFGLPTHSYIVWLIVTARGTGITSEFFTLNTSVCEIVLCLRSLCAIMLNTFPVLWSILRFLSGFVITGRFFQCLICVERYLAVVHPVTFLKYKPLRYRVMCSVLTWLMIVVYCVFSLLSQPFLNHIFTYLYISQFFLFLSVNLFCCLAVMRALKQSRPGEKRREEENHMKRRAFYIILITTGCLLIIYLPSLIVTLHYILQMQSIPKLNSFTLTCFILPGFVQPFLYIQRVGKLAFCRSWLLTLRI